MGGNGSRRSSSSSQESIGKEETEDKDLTLNQILSRTYPFLDDGSDVERKQSKTHVRKVYRLLLLGPGESGKSTVVKQMKISYGNGFPENERASKVKFIRQNLRDAVLTIVAAMNSQGRDIQVETDNEPSLRYMLRPERTAALPDDEFYDHAELLWKDVGVQECYKYANEYQLIDCAKHFLDQIATIRQPNYDPSYEDILRCRVMTTGILQSEFIVKGVQFCVFDVGGQRDERRKWIQCFNDLTGLIFVAAINSYNQAVREDTDADNSRITKRNRITESLELFQFIWQTRWLRHLSVILFLNKQDLLKEQCERSRIDEYFPEITEYRRKFPETLTHSDCGDCGCFGRKTNADEDEPDELSEFNIARNFFLQEFEKLAPKNNEADVRMAAAERRVSAACRQLYPHFTCAIDTENMTRVFKSCRHNIMRENLQNTHLV